MASAEPRARAARPADRVLFAPQSPRALRPDASEDLPKYWRWRERQRSLRTSSVPPPRGPDIEVLVVVDDPRPSALRRCLRALRDQTASHWHLTLTVLGTPAGEVHAVLSEELEALGPGHAAVLSEPSGTDHAAAVAAALEECASPACAFIDPADELEPDALDLLSAALLEADIAYADEDRIDAAGRAFAPMLKPDWAPELFLGWRYTGRPIACRLAPVITAGGIRSLDGGDWEHDLLLRITARSQRVAHVAEVLCHRHVEPVDPKQGPGAVVAELARRGEQADVEAGPLPGTWRVRRRPARRTDVTAIVPFRDSTRLLRNCVDSVLSTVDADVALKVVLVDNGSTEPETLTLLEQLAERPGVVVRRDDRPFNWAALNNAAASGLDTDVLVFLNDDIEACRTGWLSLLTAQAMREEVGAVGARLLYPTGQVQHAGIVTGLCGVTGHILAGLPGAAPGYLGIAALTRDVSAVTGACLASRRDVFDRLGGFEELLGLDYNDVDYCLRARARGLRVVYEAGAELVHHESPSRGTSGSSETAVVFMSRWGGLVAEGDPYLNRHLSRLDFSAALDAPGGEGTDP